MRANIIAIHRRAIVGWAKRFTLPTVAMVGKKNICPPYAFSAREKGRDKSRPYMQHFRRGAIYRALCTTPHPNPVGARFHAEYCALAHIFCGEAKHWLIAPQTQTQTQTPTHTPHFRRGAIYRAPCATLPTSHQSGFIQNLILPSLILIGVVVAGLGVIMEKNQRGLSIAESTTAAREQLSVIRDALSICRITWPAGDNGTLVPHVIYPATPGAALGAVPSNAVWGSVASLVCPGANNGTGQNLWTAISYNIPQAPRGLSAWQYQNVAGGVYLKLDATEQDGEFVLKQVAQRLPVSEKTLTATSLTILLMN